MPQIITPLAIYASAYIGGSIAVWEAVIAVAAIAGSYAIQKSMMKLPDFSSLENSAGAKMQMTRETTPGRRVIYGLNKVSGPIIFATTCGVKNTSLDLVIALAGHECNGGGTAGHKGMYLNDMLYQTEDGEIQYPFVGKVDSLVKLGGFGQNAFNIPGTEWAVNEVSRSLDGITAVHTHMIHDPQVFPGGLPNVSLVIKGKKCKDVRNLSAAAAYTDNSANVLYDYMTSEFGVADDEIHINSFIDGANICDQEITGSGGFVENKRYECNYSFQTSEKPATIIENILKSCYGKLIYANGKFQLKVGAPSVPLLTLTESDLRAGITVTTKASVAEAYNSVTGIFVDGQYPSSSFQPGEFVPYSPALYLTEDNNIPNVLNIELPSVTNQKIARRLAKIALIDSRQDLVLNYPCKPSALQLIPGDVLYVKNTRMGWATLNGGLGKLFEVIALSINPDLGVDLTLKETSNDIWAWGDSDQIIDRDLSPNTDFNNPFVVDPITGFTLTETTTQDKDGTIFPSVTATWDDPGSGSIAKVELDFKSSSLADWSSLARLANNATEYTTLDVIAKNQYNFRIRQYNYFGVYSTYASGSITVVGDNVAPQDPTSMTVTGASGSLYVTWTNPAVDTDYKVTNVKLNTTNNLGTAYGQGSVAGTSWNRTISTSGDYYVWLQNVDTSHNTSSYAYAGYANVPAIGSGTAGPSGSAGDIMTDIYKRSQLVPATPSGNLPVSGWSLTIPADDGNALWISTGKINGTDGTTLIGTWSVPKRLSGQASYYQATAPNNGVDATLAYGDLWFDTDDKYTVYRWNGSSWANVRDADISPMSASIVTMNGQYTVAIGNGDRVTGFKLMSSAASSSFDVQSDRFRIYNVTNGTVTQSFQADANGVYMDEAVIRSLNAGKITAGSITAAVTMSAAYIQGGTIAGAGMYVESGIGLRRSTDGGVLTITGGSDNGPSKGAQIDLIGNNYPTSAAGGQLILQSGYGAASEIRMLTNNLNNSVGVDRLSIDTYGIVRVERNNSLGGSPTANAGCLAVAQSLSVGYTGPQSDTQGQIDAAGAVNGASFNTPSALRLKENIIPFTKGIDTIMKLVPVSYDLKDGSKRGEVGFVAERVSEVIPNIVNYKDGEVAGLDYSRIVPFLVAAIQEQNIVIENMRQRLSKLEREI